MINHQINGYLAKRFDTSDLATGINWILSDENRHKDLCLKAREKRRLVLILRMWQNSMKVSIRR